MPNAGGVLMLYGFTMHLGAKISLFRSFGIVPANRGIRMKGLYAFVRHPMYAGYFLTHAGFLLASPSLFNLLVYVCCWGVQLCRMFAEERVLLESADYRVYVKKVPYRVIPFVF